WAYGAMARRGSDYVESEAAEEKLRAWMEGGQKVGDLLFNNMEAAVFEKYVPLAVLKRELRERMGTPILMSGSGSTLFAAVETDEQVAAGRRFFRDACGESGWMVETRLRGGLRIAD